MVGKSRTCFCSPEGAVTLSRSYVIYTDPSFFKRRVFLTSPLCFFDAAELKDAAGIAFWCNRPVTGAVPQETFEVRLAGFRRGCVVHFFDRAEFLHRHISSHLSL